MPYKDPQKDKECHDRYRKTPEGKASAKRRQQRYYAIPENREKARKYSYEYNRSEKGRLALRKGMLKKYGLTIESYDRMLANQKGVCALCGLPPIFNKLLDVDHNHITKEVRGLVHRRCNYRISIFDDWRERIQKYMDSISDRLSIGGLNE